MTRRAWHLDVAAGLLLAAGLLVALAVFSHDPADAAGAVYPPPATTHNLLGPPGAWLADALMQAVGLAVYVWLAGWFVLVLALLLRRDRLTWSRRLLGWVVLVPATALLATALGRAWPNGPLVGPGGNLGAWLALLLEDRFPPEEQLLVAAACLALGIALALDAVLLPLLRAALWLTVRALRLLRQRKPAPALATAPSRRPSRQAVPIRTLPVVAEQEPDPEKAEPPIEADEPEEAAEQNRPIPIHHHDQMLTDAPRERVFPRSVRLPAADADEAGRFDGFELPPLDLLEDARPFDYGNQDGALRERAALLEKTFTDFGLNVRVVGINTGPVITQFEVALETGLRIQKVTRLGDDIALNLKAPSVRIVAPIPGKNAVGIEIPNEQRADVRLKEVILAAAKRAARCKIPLFLGKDGEGRPLVVDLADMPHLLIAGSTGTGKSVCMNAIILSMLMTRRPDEVKMIMVDPKVVELSQYGRMPHLMHPIVTDMKKAEAILAWAVDKMEERYDILRRARVRNIAAFNDLPAGEALRRVAPEEDERDRVPERMPYIVIFIDEMADLILTMKKEVEGHIIRLAQKSRAAGIHLVVATQKPTVDVITGLIKSNLPARICFKVVNKSDSRVVLDEMGAEKLLGRGDMLFLQPGTSTLVRGQGTYASDQEIAQVVEALDSEPCFAQELIQLNAVSPGDLAERLRSRDDLYEPAIDIVLREGRGSVSLLQRALGIGYGRAARLIDFMAEDGIVGGYNGSNAREVMYTPEQWSQLRGGNAEAG